MGSVELVIVVCLAVLVLNALALALLSGARSRVRDWSAFDAAAARQQAILELSWHPERVKTRWLSQDEARTVRRFWPNAPDSDITD